MRDLFFLSALTLFRAGDCHMGISNPKPLDMARGDAYRYPVSSDNQPTEGGACHGYASGAVYTWVWTPAASGTCEIYQNCWSSLPASGSLTTSFGAAHNGGPCKLYKCTGPVTLPPCTRNFLPSSFGSCTEIADAPRCTLTGKLDYSGGGGSTGTTTTFPPTPVVSFPPGATPTKIRCGTSWNDANNKCGTPCINNAQCTAPEVCYADLKDCPSGTSTPVEKPVRPVSPTPAGGVCVSIQSHITDTWCQAVKCDPVYAAYCSSAPTAKSMMAAQLTVTTCEPYATFAGQTWDDVALIYDVSVVELKAANPSAPAVLVANVVLELPGDCAKALQQVQQGSASTSSVCVATVTALLAAVVAQF